MTYKFSDLPIGDISAQDKLAIRDNLQAAWEILSRQLCRHETNSAFQAISSLVQLDKGLASHAKESDGEGHAFNSSQIGLMATIVHGLEEADKAFSGINQETLLCHLVPKRFFGEAPRVSTDRRTVEVFREQLKVQHGSLAKQIREYGGPQ